MVSLKNNRFLILGAGNMGISFVKALIQNDISASKIFILEKKISSELKKIKLRKKIKILKEVSKLPKNFRPNIVLLAVKPNQLDSAINEELINIISDSLIISIIAGKKIRELKKLTRRWLVIAPNADLMDVLGTFKNSRQVLWYLKENLNNFDIDWK